MFNNWMHIGPTILASFLASLVECVEALTVILAAGSTRSWSGALSGAAAALGVILVLIATLGRALTRVPLHTLQWIVGALLLLFGMRWLRKAILRCRFSNYLAYFCSDYLAQMGSARDLPDSASLGNARG